jgi:tripartite-type tricarboxylate transporter receptor subunit TctC
VSALKSTDVRDKLTNLGLEPQPSTADALARLVAADVKRWAKVIERTGIEPQ